MPVGCLIFAFVVAVGFTALAQCKERDRKAVTQTLLDRIAVVNELPEIDHEHVEKILRTKLRSDPTHSNEFFKFFAAGSDSEGSIRSLDYRVALAQPTKRIFLMVEPAERLNLRAPDVISKFGHPNEVRALPPPAGRESSVYIYKNRYGELRFGIMPGEEQRISSVVIDRTD